MKKISFTLVIVFGIFTCFSVLTVSAETQTPEKALLLDDYSRESPEDYSADGLINYVAPRLAEDPEIEEGVLCLSYDGSETEYFGEGFMAKGEFSYLVIKMRGEKGGEESQFSLTGEYEEESPLRKTFSEYVLYNGKTPKITPEWQYFIIHLEDSGINIDNGILDLNFKFDKGDSGRIFLDEIYLANEIKSHDETKSGSVFDNYILTALTICFGILALYIVFRIVRKKK